MSFEYWNKLADHFVFISSLLGGFSIAVVASLIAYDSKNRFVIYILKAATVAAGCFLVSVFAMTDILMKTTPGYPTHVVENDWLLSRVIGMGALFFGIISLLIVISLSGWTKSRRTGIFTTIVGVLTFLLVLILI